MIRGADMKKTDYLPSGRGAPPRLASSAGQADHAPLLTSGLSVAILSDETGWHTSRLRRALQARGCTARCVDLADCRFDSRWAPHGLVIPGFGRRLPDAAIVRGIAGGSFEQVTLRLGILHALRECGVPVYNDARAIERSVDKSMTAFLLHRAGIPTPPTWTSESSAQAQRVWIRETAAGHELVLKPLFGSQGKGLQRIGAHADGPVPLPSLAGYGKVAHLQRFVPSACVPGFDWRILVVGGQAVAAMKRISEDWVHNAAQGAHCVADDPPDAIKRLAERACAVIGLDYGGVDLIPAADSVDGALVLEVNGVAAWRALQGVTPIDIAGLLVGDLLDRKLPAFQREQRA